MTIESMLRINNLRTSASDIIEKLENISENDIYRIALKVQMDLFLSETLRYLFNHKIWSSAKTVLDLGCGPGDLLSYLAKYFPNKLYTGVDINESFIKIAKKQTNALKNCEFICNDLYNFSDGNYDVIILRAVLQHLKNPVRLLHQLRELLKDNSVVIFNDTPDENFVNSIPKILTFDNFYNQLEVMQKEGGGNRNCLVDLANNLASHNFTLIEAIDQIIPITTEENKLKIIQYLILGCAVAKKMLSIRMELKDLFNDLIKWYDSNPSYIQIKTKWMVIKPIETIETSEVTT